MPASPSIEFIAEKLEFIVGLVKELTAKTDESREENTREHQRLQASVERSHSRIDANEKDIAIVKADLVEIKALMPWVKAIKYTLMGLSIPSVLAGLVFLWEVITHRITIGP